MRNYDNGILDTSTEYFHVASQFAKNTLYYLISGGNYHCNQEFDIHMKSRPDTCYLMLIQKGTLYVELNGKNYTASTGSVFVLNHNMEYHYYAKDLLSLQWIQFGGITTENYIDELYRTNSINGPVFPIDNPAEMTKKFDFIMSMFADNQVNEPVASLYIHDILTSLTLLYPLSSEDTEQSMIEVAHYIDRFYNDNLTVNNLAKACNLCVYYFIRAFQKVHGCTPYQYLVGVRFENAKRLLLTTNLSIEEIGQMVGFSSGSNFARSFKKEFGCSPSAYRKYPPQNEN